MSDGVEKEERRESWRGGEWSEWIRRRGKKRKQERKRKGEENKKEKKENIRKGNLDILPFNPIGEAALSNVFQNSSNFNRETATSEESKLELFLEEPKLCQTDSKIIYEPEG